MVLLGKSFISVQKYMYIYIPLYMTQPWHGQIEAWWREKEDENSQKEESTPREKERIPQTSANQEDQQQREPQREKHEITRAQANKRESVRETHAYIE